jgi:mannose/cellobiose epimerase-like protein (N-acyl-D-glucosamine 2-epimerase family)
LYLLKYNSDYKNLQRGTAMFLSKKRKVNITLLVVFIATILLLLSYTLSLNFEKKNEIKPLVYPVEDVEKILNELPTGERWIQHLNEDLLPFWTMKTALGKDGDFPTYRCNDGSLYDKNNPCEELKKESEIVNLDREYMRSKSRQTFAYGIAYHLTGREEYLKYAKQGVDYLVNNILIAQGNKGVITYTDKDGIPCPEKERISQDMAYILSGLSFFYYLTHDAKILDYIINIKNYIFKTFYDKDLDLLKWILEKSTDGRNDPRQKELVSQLDQIYAYMIWLTSALPEKYQKEWKEDLVALTHIMIKQFYGQNYNLFWGAITNTESKQLGTPHTDFGHSTKTLWLIYRVGILTDHLDLINFAKKRILERLDTAYIEKTGSWARGFKKDATGKNWIIDEDKEWWACAVLDQVSATMGLVEPIYAKYLINTYYYWFTYMVDHENHGVWHMVNASDNSPNHDSPKQHSWKNAWHTFEHALIGYITSNQLHDQPVKLYYAFETKPNKQNIHPYLYLAKVKNTPISSIGNFEWTKLKNYHKYEVEFSDIR